jgi:transposase
MNTNTDELLNQHYARLLGLGEEWRVREVCLDVGGRRLDIYLEYAEKAAICPRCGSLCGLHDSQPERTWRHLDTMQFVTLIHARTPRVGCPGHGVQVIELPWAEKHGRFTLLFESFAIEVLRGARSLSDACKLLRLSWDQVQPIMARAVARGLERRGEDEIAFAGMDEKSFLSGRGPDAFASIMTDLDGSRVLEVVRGRSEEGAGELVEKALTARQREMVCGVAIDMSAPYAKAIREKLPNADIVYDRFHVQKHLNEAVDAVRRQENARLLKAKDRRLAKTKYLWLAGPGHLSDEAVARREDLLRVSLKTGKAWGLKEMFSCFWRSRDKDFAAADFDFWHAQVLRSGLRPMIRAAATLKKHLGGLLAWFDCRIDNAMSEGYNSVIQALKSAARGFRNFENYRIAILFHCGKLDMQPDLVRVGAALPT